MNRITRTLATLVLATSTATAALTFAGTAAHAEGPSGPGTFQVGPIVDPEGPEITNPTPAPVPDPPKPPKPQVDGADEITDTPDCTHGCGGQDEPGDAAPAPEDQPTQPEQPTDNPAEDADLDQGCFTGCNLPEDDGADDAGKAGSGAPAPVEDSIATPSRIDAGLDAENSAPTAVIEEPAAGAGLSWYLGLGLFSIAAGALVALIARRLHEKARASRA